MRVINFDNNFPTDSFVFVTWITIKRGYEFGYLLQDDFHTSLNLSIYIHNNRNPLERISSSMENMIFVLHSNIHILPPGGQIHHSSRVTGRADTSLTCSCARASR